jgi:site-specific DNA recombinase
MPSKKVIELIRVSTANQAGDDRASIPAQRTINRHTALAHGLEIETSIEMTDVSGAAVMHAPEMHRLIELLRTKRYHGVVAREFSRLMRPENFYDMGLLQEFVYANAILYLPEGPMDFSSKTGRLLGTIRAAMAGAERTELLERSWGAKEEMRRAGKCPSSDITWPHGVAYHEDNGWHYTPEAEQVLKAFQLFTQGHVNYTALSQKTGLTRTALACILTNPIYTGWRVYDKRRDQSPDAKLLAANGRQGDRRKICRNPEDVIRVQVITSPLVSQQMFDAAQRIIEAKKKGHWRQREDTEHRFIYSGFLVCAACQSSIYTLGGDTRKMRDAGKKGYDYYVCRERKGWSRNCRTSHMGRERLETKLDDLFAERLTDRGYLRELAEEFMRRMQSRNGRATIQRLQQSIETLRQRRERVIESVIDGMISREDGKARTAAIDRDLQAAQDALLREAPGAQEITPEHLALVLAPLFNWKFLEREHKRRYLAASVPQIHVADYKVHGIGVLQGNVIPEQPGAAVQCSEDQRFGTYVSHRRMVYSWMRHTGIARSPASR